MVSDSIKKMNEEAISNILVDVDFIEQSLRDSGQAHLSSIFDHLKQVGSCRLSIYSNTYGCA